MIPAVDVDVVPVLPAAAAYWMPPGDAVGSDGIGNFRGVWAIRSTRADAAALVERERTTVRELDALSADAAEFDRRARIVEAQPGFGGLEIGVAGLSYALAAIGCVPAASCRGHVGADAWSYAPVVFPAVDRPRAEWLAPRVRRAGCGFGIGADRENLLAIRARSIVATMELAAVILREAAIIPPPAQ